MSPAITEYYRDSHFCLDKLTVPEREKVEDVEKKIVSAQKALGHTLRKSQSDPSRLKAWKKKDQKEAKPVVALARVLSESLLFAKNSNLNDAEKLLCFAKNSIKAKTVGNQDEQELITTFKKELEEIVTTRSIERFQNFCAHINHLQLERKVLAALAGNKLDELVCLLTENPALPSADVTKAIEEGKIEGKQLLEQIIDFIDEHQGGPWDEKWVKEIKNIVLKHAVNVSPWAQSPLGSPGHLADEKRSVTQMLTGLSDDFDGWITTHLKGNESQLKEWKEVKEGIDSYHKKIAASEEFPQLAKDSEEVKSALKWLNENGEERLPLERIDQILSIADRYVYSKIKTGNAHLKSLLCDPESYRSPTDPDDPESKLPSLAIRVLNDLEKQVNAARVRTERDNDEILAKELIQENGECIERWRQFLTTLPESNDDVAALTDKALNSLADINATLRGTAPSWQNRMQAAGFKKVSTLGSGSSAEVELWERRIVVRDPKTKQLKPKIERVVVKEITSNFPEMNPLQLYNEWIRGSEGERIARIDDPHLLYVKGAFISQNADDKGRLDAYVLDYVAKGKELSDAIEELLQPGNEANLRETALHFLEGIEVLHEHNIIHGDIKLENAMWIEKDNEVKIIDPGFSTQLSPLISAVAYSRGTPLYAAPEAFKEQPYNEKVDLFAAGVVLFVLYTGGVPWEDDELPLANQDVIDAVPWECIKDEDLRKLIQSMVSYDPEKRPTMKEAVETFTKIQFVTSSEEESK